MGGVSCSKVLLAKAVSNRWATLQKRGGEDGTETVSVLRK